MTKRLGSGYYVMARGWMQHPVFRAEPYTEREAWLWLIEAASWKARRYRLGDAVFDLDRGQHDAGLQLERSRVDNDF